MPGLRVQRQVQDAGLPVDLGAAVPGMQVPRDRTGLQCQHDLLKACHAGRGLQMAEIGLDRPDGQRPARGAGQGPENRLKCPCLDRVAERRAGPMRLDIVDIAGFAAGPVQRPPDDTLLRRPVGHGQAAGAPVLVDRRTMDQRKHPVAVTLRVVQPLEEDDGTAFGTADAVGLGRERLAAAVRGQHPRTRMV